jgi:hypothetical protein
MLILLGKRHFACLALLAASISPSLHNATQPLWKDESSIHRSRNRPMPPL